MDLKYPKKFDPNDFPDNTLEAFKDFVHQYGYIYDSLNRDPPNSVKTDAEIRSWISKDKRKVFLGRFSHRNLQKQYEDLTESGAREEMTFENMIKAFEGKFKLSSNTTLANFKFRNIAQNDDESFDLFCIRVKREASGCNFKCTHDDCTVSEVLIRDQILIGTNSSDIQQQALKDEWNLDTLIAKGRSIEASKKGAATIKKEEDYRTEVHRTNRHPPGKYSRKY